MDLSIHTAPLPHTDPEASPALYRDVLGLEVRKDVGSGEMPATWSASRNCAE